MSAENEPLVLRRTYDAPQERVFQAWTDAKQMERWYTPDIENPTVIRYVDLRVGGGYQVAFGAPAGEEPYVETGVYLEVDPPRRLVFEATLERAGDTIAQTHNTVEFIEREGRTELVMTETGFPEKYRAEREAGWGRTVDNLFGALD